MGLDYLNKKVWHPGSMKNIQKVWQVQQVQREINKKARERAKKLLQEQHNDELKRIQVEAGLIPRSHLDRMEWMYDWGNKINQNKTNEQFLTGKKEAEVGDDKKEFKHVFQEEITNRKCEDFQLLHEDPMFEIMRQEKARKDAIMNNPIEMRNIIKEVEKEYLPQDLEERRQKHMSSRRQPSQSESEERKRKHKREKKHKKEHRRQRSRSKQRSRSRSVQKKRRSRSDSTQKRSEGGSRSDKKSFKQSSLYQSYLKDNFSGILKTDEKGNLKPDYTVHRKKYKTQIQMDEEERRRKTEEMRENAKKLQELREKERRGPREEKECDFEGGVAKIRGQMFNEVRENRNFKKYKGSDSE